MSCPWELSVKIYNLLALCTLSIHVGLAVIRNIEQHPFDIGIYVVYHFTEQHISIQTYCCLNVQHWSSGPVYPLTVT